MPDFVENHQLKFVGARWRHVRLWSKQRTYNVHVNDVDLISAPFTSKLLTESRSFGELLSCNHDGALQLVAIDDEKTIRH